MNNLSAKILELDNGVYVIPSSTNVGVITDTNGDTTEVYLVDSGSTEIEGEYILDILQAFFEEQQQKYVLKGIFTTHGHADHCGAHSYIKQQTDCEILATKTEQANMETPIVQSAILWGGYPPHELRTLYFKPEKTFIDSYLSETSEFKLHDGRTISFMELNGHSLGQIIVIVTNEEGKKVVFAGDCIFPRKELGKYWVPLITNPVDFINSLDSLCSIDNMEWCIPSHGDFLKKNIEETAELNKIAVISTRMCILEALKDKELHSLDDIVQYVADKNEMNMSIGQYALISSTIKSYISIMHDAKELKMKIDNNRLWFFIE